MSENRLAHNLQQARRNGRKCLMPYVTAGYPDLQTTVELIKRFDAAGCQAVEIGFPFSDSIADGPVIQESFQRALDAGFRVEELFDAIAGVRDSVSVGLLAMVSMSIVRRFGLSTFVEKAVAAGFDGLIVPDVPVDECDELAGMTASAGLCNVLMSAPTSSDDRRVKIGAKSTGFIYIVAAKGITGERQDVAGDLAERIAAMRKATDAPLIVGFGISTPEHVGKVCQSADGVIVGSAIIRRITKCVGEGKSTADTVDAVGTYIDELITGLPASA